MNRKQPWVLLAVAMSFGASSAKAAPAKSKSKADESHIVIIGGGKTRADADAALESFTKKQVAVLGIPDGYPRVFKSDELAGLNPGFHIVVLGFCPKSKAVEVSALANIYQPGTYTKKVGSFFPDSCPVVRKLPSKREPRHKEVDTLNFPAPNDSLNWEVFTSDFSEDDGFCEAPDLIVQVRRGKVLLAEEVFAGYCRRGSEEDGDSGSSDTYSVSESIKVGGETFVVIDDESRAGDNGTRRSSLYGFCGTIQNLLSLGSKVIYGPPDEYALSTEDEEDKDGKPGRALLVVTQTSSEGSTASYYAWNRDDCALELLREEREGDDAENAAPPKSPAP